MNNIITVKNFQMRFGRKTVIEDLSFEVKKGEVFGFLGSNGSGKTTTIRSLLGIYQPTAGELLINGEKFTPKMSSFIGYLPEERGLYKKETVLDTMVYFGRLKGMTYEAAKEWSLNFLERIGLADKSKEQLDRLSGGQQQKVQLGVTIMGQPKLLILDEPTKGFDPVNRRLMMDIIEELRANGATVMLVTHQMEEVERLCDRVMLLKDGKRRLYGTVEEIKESYGEKHILIQFKGTFEPDNKLYAVIKSTASTAELLPTDKTTTHDIFTSLAKQKELTVTKFELAQNSLDEIFVQIYEEDKAGKHA